MVRQVARQGALVQQRARSQRGTGAGGGVRAARPARSSSTTTCGLRGRRPASSPTSAASPATRCARTAGSSVSTGRSTGRRGGLVQAVRRNDLRPEFTRRRSRSCGRSTKMRILEDNERRRPEHRRARPRAGRRWASSSRIATSTRGPVRDGGRHRAQAHREGVGGDAVRLEGVQARPLQRDRHLQGARLDRDRRRSDEPGGLGPARGGEGPGEPARRWTGSALASDAFFPFSDGPQLAIDAGIRASSARRVVRDPEVVEAADAAGISMVFTHRRHFKH